MIHRLAIVLGSVAAAAILAIGVAASGFGPTVAPANAEQPDLAAAVAEAAAVTVPAVATPITRVETTTVYVRPPAKPKVIHVTRHVPAPKVRQRPQVKVVHVTKVTSNKHKDDDERDEEDHEHEDEGHERDDDGGEHERGDD